MNVIYVMQQRVYNLKPDTDNGSIKFSIVNTNTNAKCTTSSNYASSSPISNPSNIRKTMEQHEDENQDEDEVETPQQLPGEQFEICTNCHESSSSSSSSCTFIYMSSNMCLQTQYNVG